DYLVFKFTGILVSSLKLGGQGNNPSEQGMFNFQKLTETFQGVDAKGKKIAPVTITVNVNNSVKFRCPRRRRATRTSASPTRVSPTRRLIRRASRSSRACSVSTRSPPR